MIYPNNFEQKIGFQQVRELLAENCLSALGRGFVTRMQFLDRFDLVQKLLQQTHEFQRLLASGVDFPTQHFYDVSSHLNRAMIAGAFLEVQAFFEIKMSLRTIRQSLISISGPADEPYPALKALADQVEIQWSLISALDKLVDDNGHVNDDASPELLRLKRELIHRQSLLRKQIQTIMRHAKSQGWTPDDAEPTIRGGRIVIPVLAEHKRRVKGLIHDESATGQTIYLEPDVVFELNNDIKDLENAYNRELIRLLTALTTTLREYVPELRKAYQYLGLIDFIRAKTIFANRVEAIMPELQKQPVMKWKQARHPLLYLSLKAQNREVVPLSLELNPEQRILLISGPNAGGKSVALKTAGLLQYMLQCGLLIPVNESSEAGIFEDVFLDIGDEQSIENDLSTYSSHLQNMKQFVLFAGKKSLVLIDEFGTGTEPILGGSIAEAVLEKLHKERAFGVITTHYTNLKNFAERTPGIVNGAMRYDHQHLQPLYQLEIGKPGSSFAIEIARKIGLPKEIVQKASSLVGKDKIRYDRLLEELESEKMALEKKLHEVERQEAKLKRSVQEYTELRNYLDETKAETMREAKGKAKLLLREANQQIENTIKQIRESQADKEATKAARQQLEQFSEKNVKLEPLKAKQQKAVSAGELKPGDKVSLIGQDGVGEILSLKDKSAEVMFGQLKTYVKLNQLERAESNKSKKEKTPVAASYKGFDITQRRSDFTATLELRGERAEDALNKLMSFVDEALMLGMPELKVIHGRGNGVLRQVVRDYLHSLREVVSVADEHAERGGDGATIAVLK